MTLEEVGTLAIDMAVRKGRNDKVELLLEAFERLEANERAIFVQLFSGQVPGGKIGVAAERSGVDKTMPGINHAQHRVSFQ